MSGRVHGPTTYFELPGERRQPLWRLTLFVLLVLAAHLIGLFLAFGTLSRNVPPEALPVLAVRVFELATVPPRVAEPRPLEPPRKAEPARAFEQTREVAPVRKRQRPGVSRTSPAPVKSVSPTPPPVLTAAATASATIALTVAPPAAAGSAEPPAARVAASAPRVAARFDADYLRNPRPVYPAASRRLGEEGRVLLRIRVSAQGLPLAVEIKQSSGFQRLDEAARAAVEHWRFIPARQGSEAVESSVLVPLQFTLND